MKGANTMMDSLRVENSDSTKIEEDVKFEEKDPYEGITFKKVQSTIKNKNGKVIFNEEVEFPDYFDENDINIVASKYLCNSAKAKETSLKQMVERIGDTITEMGDKQGYFDVGLIDKEEFRYWLKYYQIRQYCAFNSPVYFNVGLEDPAQVSACFILDIQDDMDSISGITQLESRIFKWGSGSGINMSNLRSRKEKVRGGGHACLTDDTVVYINEEKRTTIKNLWKMKVDNIDFPDILSAKDAKRIIPNRIIDIVYNGHQVVYKMDTSLGYTIKATMNHRFLSKQDGWQPLEYFNEGDCIAVSDGDKLNYDTIIDINKFGKEHVYDLQMESPFHNFIANGLLSHNSGPTSFMKTHDTNAGVIRSGGTLRRSAKLVCLDDWHPDILHFINCKKREEEKLRILMNSGFEPEEGYDPSDDAYYQNTNISVRLSDEFMEAVENDDKWSTKYVLTGETCDTYNAKDILKEISETAWETADPGILFSGAMNKWNTTKKVGEITTSNPCNPDWIPVLTPNGYKKFRDINNKVFVGGKENECSDLIFTGTKKVYEIVLKSGLRLYATDNHKINTEYGDVEVKDLTVNSKVRVDYTKIPYEFDKEEFEKGLLCGFLFADGTIDKHCKYFCFSLGIEEFDFEHVFLELIHKYTDSDKTFKPHGQKPDTCRLLGVNKKKIVENFFNNIFKAKNKNEFDLFDHSISFQKGFIQSMISCDGHVVNSGYTKHVGITQSGKKGYNILSQIQLSLASMGIYCYFGIHNHEMSGIRDGKEFHYKTVYKLEINDVWEFDKEFELYSTNKQKRVKEIVSIPKSHPTRITNLKTFQHIKEINDYSEEEVYDIQVPDIHYFVASGVVVHNCGEYLSPIIEENGGAACNLASCNFLKFFKFKQVGESFEVNFDFENFERLIKIMIIAQDIIINAGSYPNNKIRNNAVKLRPLGFGFSNLGSTLMNMCLPYDSDEGRLLASLLTSLLTSTAFCISKDMGQKLGSFELFKENEESFRDVMEIHSDKNDKLYIDNGFDNDNNFRHNELYNKMFTKCSSNWDKVCGINDFKDEPYEFRNSQVSLAMPTGTVSFLMGCTTTGIEPEFSHVKYKTLSGNEGAMMTIVNKDVSNVLFRLGYTAEEVMNIELDLKHDGCLDNCNKIKEEHLPIFDTSTSKNTNGRSIHYMGHLKMLGAVQPFLSGAISKTVSCPNNITPEEIGDIYVDAWKRGLKGLTIYRDGSKTYQPLKTSDECKSIDVKLERKKLLDDRESLTHKFSFGGIKGYITSGKYEDGKLGEVFITCNKMGSTINGLLDSIGILMSISLQYGVPLEDYVRKFMNTRFEPAGFTRNPDIRSTTSIVDYMVRHLGNRYLTEDQKEELGLNINSPCIDNGINPVMQSQTILTNSDISQSATFCSECGNIMKRIGSTCYQCGHCGHNTGVCG